MYVLGENDHWFLVYIGTTYKSIKIKIATAPNSILNNKEKETTIDKR